VLAIKPGRGSGAEEELGAVGAGAGIGHRQHAGAVVLKRKVLVVERRAVDALAACAVACREVAALRAGTLAASDVRPQALRVTCFRTSGGCSCQPTVRRREKEAESGREQ
jgi:hypothetical protein